MLLAGFAGVGRASLGGPLTSRLLTGGVMKGGSFNQSDVIGAIEFAIILMALVSAAIAIGKEVREYRDVKNDYYAFVDAYIDAVGFRSEVNAARARAKCDVLARNISFFQKKKDLEGEKLLAARIIDAEKKLEERDIVTSASHRKDNGSQKKKGGGNKRKNKKKGAAA